TITYQDIPVEPWRDGLLKSGLPVHLVNHFVTMADLHRAGRYDRMSDDVLTLTGQRPLSLQEVIRKNAAAFTALGEGGGGARGRRQGTGAGGRDDLGLPSDVR